MSRWGDQLSQIMNPDGKAEALDDTLVLDLSFANFSGIITASFFAEAGAEVIKVEPPEGDPARVMTPYGETVEGVGIPFLSEGRNKRHITLDVSQPDDLEKLKKLVIKADVLIESYAPGEMDSLELGYRQLKELNPGLIYISLTPYGQFGSLAEERAGIPWSDLTSQAESGLAALIGDLPDTPEPYNWPTRAGFYAAANATAVEAATAALVALFYKRATGEGQMLDIATADAYASCVGIPPTFGHVWKHSRMRYGTLDYGLCPYGFFKCKDGHVAIACFRDQDFRAALKILGRWDMEENWRSLLDRITDDVSKVKELNDEIEKTVAKFTYDEIFNKFSAYAVKAARSKWKGGGMPVTTRMVSAKEVMDIEHWQARRTFSEVEHPVFGVLTLPTAGKMSETPPRIKWISGQLGEDNDFITKKFGL